MVAHPNGEEQGAADGAHVPQRRGLQEGREVAETQHPLAEDEHARAGEGEHGDGQGERRQPEVAVPRRRRPRHEGQRAEPPELARRPLLQVAAALLAPVARSPRATHPCSAAPTETNKSYRAASMPTATAFLVRQIEEERAAQNSACTTGGAP